MLKLAQAWGLFKNIKKLVWKLANRYKYTRDILHSTLCNGGAIADYRIDYEIR
jgi:hypothetical protein